MASGLVETQLKISWAISLHTFIPHTSNLPYPCRYTKYFSLKYASSK
jgi:hypothetical protein